MIKGSFFAVWLLASASVASAASSSLNVGVYPSYPPLDNKPLQDAQRATIDDGAYAKLIAKWGLPASSALSRVTINMGL